MNTKDLEVEFDIYGDESVHDNAVIYAALAIPRQQVELLELAISNLKRTYNLEETAQIHCSKIFPKDARERSAWKDFSDEELQNFCRKLAITTTNLGGICRMGFIDKSLCPKSFPGDNLLKETHFKDEYLFGFAFHAALADFDESPGFDKIRLWVDPSTTKIFWFNRRRIAGRNYRTWSGITDRKLIPEEITGSKPVLLQMADLVAYAASHSLSRKQISNKALFYSVYKAFRTEKVDYIFDPVDVPRLKLEL